ncbi:tetratricopeptide repeat protein, partial [Streptomyces sp. NPDC002156]
PTEPQAQAPAPDDLPALLAEARRMSDGLLPNAMEAWAAVSRAAEGVEVSVSDQAEIVDHKAMEGGPEGIALFERAAELYAEAGDPGEALAARARAAYARALEGDVDAALDAVSEPYEEVLALYSDEGTGVRQAAAVLMGRARILMRQVEETGTDRALAAAENAVRELLALVDGHAGDDVRLASRGAEAQAMLGELATRAGDLEGAAELFTWATDAFVAAGLPWFAVEYEARLAGLAHHLGDIAEAERALRGALEHGGAYLEAAGHAQLNLQLAEILGARDEVGEAADHALEAAHWADEAGEGPTLGAWARHLLGGFLLRQGRWAEAAEVLESALPDLSAESHGDGAVVQTLWWLADCLAELGEHRESAERRLKAAEIARHWPEQQDHATLAHLAAESLGQAGLPAEADQAYERAGDLWRSLGNVHGLVRALRARAWLALRTEAGLAGARLRMQDAVRECGQALSEADDLESREQLGAELAHTHRQFGDLLARSAAEDAEDGAIEAAFEEALAQMTKAIAVFSSLGEEGLHGRTGAELAAGWLEADLSRPAEAAARARGVLRAYGGSADDSDAETVRARRAEAEQMLQLMEEQEAE